MTATLIGILLALGTLQPMELTRGEPYPLKWYTTINGVRQTEDISFAETPYTLGIVVIQPYQPSIEVRQTLYDGRGNLRRGRIIFSGHRIQGWLRLNTIYDPLPVTLRSSNQLHTANPVPEPTTMALLLLGLPLIRRFRREGV